MFDFSEFDQVALDRVRQAYAGRPYHNFNHVEKMLIGLDSVPGLSQLNKKLIQIAIIFHDVVADPRATDNEEKSVEFMLNSAPIHQVQSGKNNKTIITRLIMATKHHEYGDIGLSNIIIGRDLDILRQDFMSLVEWEHAIFKEYQFMNVADYTTKRVEFLCNTIEKLSEYWDDFSFANLRLLIKYVENRQYRIGIFAGSFSPFHIGHLSCVKKAEGVFDKVIIARGINQAKVDKFHYYRMPETLPNEMIEYKGMVTDLFKSSPKNVKYFLIRGLRNEYDLQLEENMRRWIKELDASIEIVYFFCDSQYEHISSSMLKDLAKIDPDFVDKYIVK